MSSELTGTKDLTLDRHIKKTPGILGGKARIGGHRIRVMDIVFWHEKCRRSPDEIVSEIYPDITLADVYAALTYYHDHRDEIEETFRHEAEVVAKLKAQYPSKLRDTLGE